MCVLRGLERGHTRIGGKSDLKKQFVQFPRGAENPTTATGFRDYKKSTLRFPTETYYFQFRAPKRLQQVSIWLKIVNRIFQDVLFPTPSFETATPSSKMAENSELDFPTRTIFQFQDSKGLQQVLKWLKTLNWIFPKHTISSNLSTRSTPVTVSRTESVPASGSTFTTCGPMIGDTIEYFMVRANGRGRILWYGPMVGETIKYCCGSMGGDKREKFGVDQ